MSLGGLLGIIITTVIGALTQVETNGASLWGTLGLPTLPPFLTNNPLPDGFPWGLLTAIADNPYTDMPTTGVTRNYNFSIARGQLSPDGYLKDVILINGQFPGPLIEANWGDVITVTVHNGITGPEEGTTLHWHGLLQKGTPFYDGVPAVTQCPIAPGDTFTYTFQASLYGTTWYHSHYSGQWAGGLYGPLVIHGPKTVDYDIDLGPVMVSDWYHDPYFSVVEEVIEPNGDPRPAADNNLINGKMDFDCSTKPASDNTPCTDNAGISKFKFTAGKTHRLRLINTGASALQRFSIDGHNLTVIANDMVPVNAYTTEVVTLGVGQRTDVLVTATYPEDSSFFMRSNISTLCSDSTQPLALAAIYYDNADTNKTPTSTPWNVPDPGTCTNDDLSLTVPVFSLAPNTPTTSQQLDIILTQNSTGSFLWELGGVSYRGNYNYPILSLAQGGNTSYPDEWNVINYGSNSTIRVVINNQSPASHPMHLHGHNMQVLAEGPGDFDGSDLTGSHNPQRRDVQLVRANGHLVIQFDADNPGVWPFHCHIAWHVSGGLYANFLERPDDIKADVTVPLVIPQTCTDWQTYSNKNVVDEIDSGL